MNVHVFSVIVCIALSACMMETAECGETYSEHNQEATHHTHMNFSRNQLKPINPNISKLQACQTMQLPLLSHHLQLRPWLFFCLGLFMDDRCSQGPELGEVFEARTEGAAPRLGNSCSSQLTNPDRTFRIL